MGLGVITFRYNGVEYFRIVLGQSERRKLLPWDNGNDGWLQWKQHLVTQDLYDEEEQRIGEVEKLWEGEDYKDWKRVMDIHERMIGSGAFLNLGGPLYDDDKILAKMKERMIWRYNLLVEVYEDHVELRRFLKDCLIKKIKREFGYRIAVSVSNSFVPTSHYKRAMSYFATREKEQREYIQTTMEGHDKLWDKMCRQYEDACAEGLYHFRRRLGFLLCMAKKKKYHQG